MEKILTQVEAAQILGVSERTLERHRTAGTGPRFTRLGRLIRYREQDLIDFVELNLCASTSEYATGSIRRAS